MSWRRGAEVVCLLGVLFFVWLDSWVGPEEEPEEADERPPPE